jgi:hypothetical protein
MSLPRETMMELMALADGELDGAARERAERLVAESDEARQVVEAIRGSRLGMWLGETTAARSAAADGIADAVMARLDGAAASPLREEGGVVRLAASRKVRNGSRRPVLAAGVAAALALAAGVAVVVRAVQLDATAPAPVASVDAPSSVGTFPVAPTVVAQQSAGPKQGVEVDEIDSPSRGVSVFEIPLGSAAAAAASAGPSSVVIWIDDEQGGK